MNNAPDEFIADLTVPPGESGAPRHIRGISSAVKRWLLSTIVGAGIGALEFWFADLRPWYDGAGLGGYVGFGIGFCWGFGVWALHPYRDET